MTTTGITKEFSKAIFSKNLTALRESHGFNKKKFAEKLGIAPSNYIRVEDPDASAYLTFPQILDVLKAFNIDFISLVEEEETSKVIEISKAKKISPSSLTENALFIKCEKLMNEIEDLKKVQSILLEKRGD